MQGELQQAIDEFRINQWATWCEVPHQAKGKCGTVSHFFYRHLEEKGITACTVEFIGAVGITAPAYPMFNHGDFIVHTVVLVESKFIDWSARQFDLDADHPAIIEPWGLFQADADEKPAIKAALKAAGIKRPRVLTRSYDMVVN